MCLNFCLPFQVQKLTDPDNPICVNQYNESPLSSSGWSTSATPPNPGSSLAGRENTGRSWTVAGSSLANMFPDQLRVPKRRDESSSSPDTTPQAPLRLSDMLKRKRVSKRTSGIEWYWKACSTESNTSTWRQLDILSCMIFKWFNVIETCEFLDNYMYFVLFSGRKGRHSEGNVHDPSSGPSTSAALGVTTGAGASSSTMYDMPGNFRFDTLLMKISML